MRRRFQAGRIIRRGKRNPVWAGMFYEPVLREGKFSRTRRTVILGACAAMTRSRAAKALVEILRPINEGLHVPACAETFGELWRKWEAEVLSNYRESTRGFYSRTVTRWILPYFERWPVEDITPLACQRFINKFGGYSRSVLRHIRASLGRVLAGAVDWRWIPQNPARALRLPAGKPAKRAAVLTPVELAQVIEKLEEPYRAMAVIAALTGIRESEVMALEWADFDRERRVLSVRRSVYCGAVGPVKSERGERGIPYGDALADALEHLRVFIETRHLEPDARLFVAPKGGYYSPQRITRLVFKPLAASLSVPAFSWRSFRRSAATALHMAGVPLKVQQNILGHASPDMSLLYTDPNLEAERKALRDFETLMESSGVKLNPRVM